MLIGDTLIKATVGRYKTENVFAQSVSNGANYDLVDITTDQEQNGMIVYSWVNVNAVAADEVYLDYTINGARIFDNRILVPKYPGVQQGFVGGPNNVYIPPNSNLIVNIDNLLGTQPVEVYSVYVLYLWYESDVVEPTPPGECPPWADQLTKLFRQAILSAR